jgi:hypothetical protein
MNTNLDEVFERVEGFEASLLTLRLRVYEWELLFRCDGERTARQIGKELGLEDSQIECALRRLQEGCLLAIRELTYLEFREYAARNNNHETTAGLPLNHDAKFNTNEPSAENAGNSDRALTGTQSDAAPIKFSLKRASSPPAPAKRKLKPILDFIIAQSPDETSGQLAAYRVLLKVPRQLFDDAGIETFHMDDGNFEIEDQILYDAILNHAREMTGKNFIPV